MQNHKGRLTVRSYEADYYGDLAIPALCDQIQDAAWIDAARIDWGLTDRQMWVLSRLALEIRGQLPRWGQGYCVETWHRGFERAFGVRDFQVATASGVVVAVATSSWLVIDRDSRRPVLLRRPPPGASDRSVLGHAAPRVPRFDWVDHKAFTPVYYGDLDVNRHVNSMTYIRWILDDYPFEFYRTHVLKSLEINFLAEALEMDHVAIGVRRADVDEARVVRRHDGQDLCRARLLWQEQPRDVNDTSQRALLGGDP